MGNVFMMEQAIPQEQLWMVIVGFIIAFVLAFGIGANDVANSFGTSVGSKVLTLRHAFILACFFETLGAVLLGSKVSETIRQGIIDIQPYENNTALLMVGNVAALSGSCVWLICATLLRLPVSGTHSIVGSTVGFALVAHGTKGIHWAKLGMIVGSWFISPILAGCVSIGLFGICKYFILNKADPLEPGLRFLPIFYAFTIVVNVFSVFYDGPRMLGFHLIPLWGTFIISFGVGIICALIARFIVVPWQRKRIKADIMTTVSSVTDDTTTAQSVTGNGNIYNNHHPPPPVQMVPMDIVVGGGTGGRERKISETKGGEPRHRVRHDSNSTTELALLSASNNIDKALGINDFNTPRSREKIKSGGGRKNFEIEEKPLMEENEHSAFPSRTNSQLRNLNHVGEDGAVCETKLNGGSAVPRGQTSLVGVGDIEGGAAALENGLNKRQHDNNNRELVAQPDLLQDDMTSLERGRMTIKDKPETGRLFSFLQILTAIFGAFAHGGNDVSNAIGPLVSLWLVATTQKVMGTASTPIWILLYGGVGISVGLCILGRKVIKTIGEDLARITPSSGFCIEIGSALTVLVASNIGIPISTTHCKVGSVVFVGRFRARENVDWSIFRNIILAWIVTLPISGGISAAIMAGLRLTVEH